VPEQEQAAYLRADRQGIGPEISAADRLLAGADSSS